jgi:hypothetical protein
VAAIQSYAIINDLLAVIPAFVETWAGCQAACTIESLEFV